MSATGKTFRLFKLDGYKVRGFVDVNGTPWLCAVDLAAPLQLTPKAVEHAIGTYPDFFSQVLEGEDVAAAKALLAPKRRALTPRNPGSQKPQKERRGGATTLTFITERAAHLLTARSKAAVIPGTFAFDFCNWLFGEVVPSLQKHGGYVMTKQARQLVQGQLGWQAIREDGKVARKAFTAVINDVFIPVAIRQGSNNYKRYNEHGTALALECARQKHGEGLRDLTEDMLLAELAVIENRLAELLEASVRAGGHYKMIWARFADTARKFFVSRELAPAPWVADPED